MMNDASCRSHALTSLFLSSLRVCGHHPFCHTCSSLSAFSPAFCLIANVLLILVMCLGRRGGRKGNADMQAAAEGHERDPNAAKDRGGSVGGGRLEMKGGATARSFGLAAPPPVSSRGGAGLGGGGPSGKRREHTLMLDDDDGTGGEQVAQSSAGQQRVAPIPAHRGASAHAGSQGLAPNRPDARDRGEREKVGGDREREREKERERERERGSKRGESDRGVRESWSRGSGRDREEKQRIERSRESDGYV